jgi:tetratricopeptide (TPR) repeat protein/SAM-dependent methyltransferase
MTHDAQAIQSTLQRAIGHHQQGHLQEAEGLYRQILQRLPRHADALHLLGVVALQRGQFKAASDLIEQAIQVRPAANYYCNLGNALKGQGQGVAAIRCYRLALAMQANMAEALCSLGSVLLEQGEVQEAMACCRQAIALQPGSAEAHCNLGNALLRQGQLDEAVGCYRQALRISPALAVVHSNLGDALCLQGRDDDALDAYHRALSTGLDTAELHHKMGMAFLRQGQLGPSIQSHLCALQRSDRSEFRAAFVQAIRSAHFRAPQAEIRAQVLRALEDVWADPGELLTPATSLIEANPAVRQGIEHARAAWPGAPGLPAWLDKALLTAIAGDRLLISLLERDTINSIALERLLTLMRRQLLDATVLGADADTVTTLLQGAIARQCFINEYVYACSDDELQQLAHLHARLGACLADGATPHPRWLLASASYAPLAQLAGAERWAALSWPEPLAAVFTQQCLEPAIERRTRAAIPCLTPIDDPTSRLVRAQYEEHPYPRWMHAPRVAAPCDVNTLLRRQMPRAAFEPVRAGGPLEVLVAGCGTGQHPIQVAQQIEDARVLAVDLSLSSLGYARRKTDELGLTNIEYAQADILNLGAINRRFDLIESAGVLHHLADPLAGWRVLLDLLLPGGLMMLGLYSELGRRDVVAARQRIAAQGLPATGAAIRQCRQQLMSDELAPQFQAFLSSRDFYATSACRDLLFHVQEHRYTLPQLQATLAQLDVKFIGFMLDTEVTAAYAREFPNDAQMTRLDHWHTFEQARPDTFSRMYQFWVQKPR